MKKKKFERLTSNAHTLDINKVSTRRLNELRESVIAYTPSNNVEEYVLCGLVEHFDFYLFERYLNKYRDVPNKQFLFDRLVEGRNLHDQGSMPNKPRLLPIREVCDYDVDSAHLVSCGVASIDDYVKYWADYYKDGVRYVSSVLR